MKKHALPLRIKARNKQARNYSFSGQYVAGIVLKGNEVKWVKQGKVNLDGSYVRIRHDEAWLCKVHFGSGFVDQNQLPGNDETYKLLLHKHELASLKQADIQKKSIVPTTFFVSHGYIKVSLGIGVVSKKYDKRNVLREREMTRTARQAGRYHA